MRRKNIISPSPQRRTPFVQYPEAPPIHAQQPEPEERYEEPEPQPAEIPLPNIPRPQPQQPQQPEIPPEQYPPQQHIPQQYQTEPPQPEPSSPLSILDEIEEDPSPKGTAPIKLGGRPIDLHVLEDYVVKISPYSLKTILRYHNARTIEEMKGYSKGVGLKMKSGTIILIIVAIAMAVLGILMMTLMPDILGNFSGGLP
jgi:hypothetical protein